MPEAVLEHPPASGTTGAVRRFLPNAFSLLVIALLLANYFSPLADLDFTWQIQAGAQIVRDRSFHVVDERTYTIDGQAVPDFEWLYEVILYATWSAFGFGGLKLLRTILVAAPLIILGVRLQRAGVRWHGILLAELAAFVLTAAAWNLRPLFVTTIGLLLVGGWLHEHCVGRRPLPIWLPVVMLAWANLHPGVITGQALLLGAISWEWINHWVRLNAPLDRAACWRLTWVGGLGVLATFVSPAPIDRLLYPFRPELAHPIMRVFLEMQPLTVFFHWLPYVVVLAYALALLVFFTVILRFRRYRLWELALLGVLTLLAHYAVRSLQDWVLQMLALGVPHMAALLGQAARAGRRRPGVAVLLRIDRTCKRMLLSWPCRFQWFAPAAVAAVLLVLSVIPPVARKMPLQAHREWPVGALDEVERRGLEGRFFGSPNTGSYVCWRLGSRGRCYVDTRGFYFPPEVLENSFVICHLGAGWRERLDAVLAGKTDYFLLETTGSWGTLWRALEPHVRDPLYRDGQSVLLSADQVRQAVRNLTGT